MATRTSKTSTVKAKAEKKTSAPKLGRAKKASIAQIATSSDAIAARAYELFCARGFVHGCDVEDWLAAEQELQSRA